MPDSVVCPHCGRESPPAISHCPHCQRLIGKSDCSRPAQAEPARHPLPARSSNPWSFSIAELLLGTTFVAVLLAVTLAVPEWGIFLWIISALALARTIWFSVAWKRAGRPFLPLAQAGSFAESLFVMALISAAATVAFLGTCFPLGVTVTHCCSPSDSEFLAGFAWVVGISAGLGSGGYLLWTLVIRPIVAWRRLGQPPTMVERIAVMGRSVVLLATTMLGSALSALSYAWGWLLALGSVLEERNARTSRIILYLVLLAGYIAGTVLGVVCGRQLVHRVRIWFWPALVVAALASIPLTIMGFHLIPGASDDSGISLGLLAVVVAFAVGLLIHRILGERG